MTKRKATTIRLLMLQVAALVIITAAATLAQSPAAAEDCRTLARWLAEPDNESEAYSVLVSGSGASRRLLVRRVWPSRAQPETIFDSASAEE